MDHTTDESYVAISPVNSQLTAMTSGTITDLRDGTYSIREYGKQQMLVNANGQQSKDGTPIIG